MTCVPLGHLWCVWALPRLGLRSTGLLSYADYSIYTNRADQGETVACTLASGCRRLPLQHCLRLRLRLRLRCRWCSSFSRSGGHGFALRDLYLDCRLAVLAMALVRRLKGLDGVLECVLWACGGIYDARG